MHELGYAFEIVKTLKEFIKENNIEKLSSITVDVGEATAIVPKFLLDCWPAVIDEEEAFKDCKLNINFIKARGRCHNCEAEFEILESQNKCPKCGCEDFDFVTGYEFEISEIRGK